MEARKPLGGNGGGSTGRRAGTGRVPADCQRIERIREKIACGAYPTQFALYGATDGLLAELESRARRAARARTN